MIRRPQTCWPGLEGEAANSWSDNFCVAWMLTG